MSTPQSNTAQVTATDRAAVGNQPDNTPATGGTQAGGGGGGVPSGPAGGDLAGAYPNPTLKPIGSAAGPVGDSTHVAAVSIDAKGRVTALTPVTIATSGGTVTSVASGTGLTATPGPITGAGSIALNKSTTTALGGVIVPAAGNLDVDGSGNISVPTASTTVLGVVKVDGTSITIAGGVISAPTGGSGTVTSVDMSVPAELTISGNPIVGAGTLAVDKATQPANEVWAGPTSGSAAKPTFRALVAADLPSVLTNPMTTLGDTIYGGASGAPTRLPGNTTARRRYYSQTGTGSASAAPAIINGNRFNVEDFGADPAGSASANVTAINAAFTALNAAGGGCLYLPRIYSVNAKLAWTFTGSTYAFSMVGDGMGVSGLVFSGSTTNNGVQITTQASGTVWTTASNVTVRDLSLIATSNASGTALHVVGPMAAGSNRGSAMPHICRVEVWFETSAYWDTGIDVESCINGVISDCQILGGAPNVGTAGIYYHGINNTDELRVVNCTINAWPKSFYGDGTVNSLEGMYFVDNDMTSSAWGIYIDNSAGAGGSVKVTGCYFACSSGGVFCNNVRGLQITGNQFDPNGNGQVQISTYDCFHGTIVGNTIIATVSTSAIGIKVDGSGTGGTLPGVMISGNVTVNVATAVEFTSGATNCRMPDHLDTTGGAYTNANTTNQLFTPGGLIRMASAANVLTDNVEATMTWGSADFDDNSLWNSSTSLVIPSWLKRIQITCFVRFPANAVGIRYIKLKDNSSNVWAEAFGPGDSGNPTGISFVSPVIDVGALGITSFTVSAYQNIGGGGTLTIPTAAVGGSSIGYEIKQ